MNDAPPPMLALEYAQEPPTLRLPMVLWVVAGLWIASELLPVIVTWYERNGLGSGWKIAIRKIAVTGPAFVSICADLRAFLLVGLIAALLSARRAIARPLVLALMGLTVAAWATEMLSPFNTDQYRSSHFASRSMVVPALLALVLPDGSLHRARTRGSYAFVAASLGLWSAAFLANPIWWSGSAWRDLLKSEAIELYVAALVTAVVAGPVFIAALVLRARRWAHLALLVLVGCAATHLLVASVDRLATWRKIGGTPPLRILLEWVLAPVLASASMGTWPWVLSVAGSSPPKPPTASSAETHAGLPVAAGET